MTNFAHALSLSPVTHPSHKKASSWAACYTSQISPCSEKMFFAETPVISRSQNTTFYHDEDRCIEPVREDAIATANCWTLRNLPPPFPGRSVSLFQAVTNVMRWKQKRPSGTIFPAEGHRRIHQNTPCAHQKCRPGAVGLGVSSEERTDQVCPKFVHTTK